MYWLENKKQWHARRLQGAIFIGELCAHARKRESSAQWFAHAFQLHQQEPIYKA